MDTQKAKILINWEEVFRDAEVMYHSSALASYNVDQGGNLLLLRHAMNNICEWGVRKWRDKSVE